MEDRKITADRPAYEPPRIVHKGQLKQFAGSPLRIDPQNDPLGLPRG